jgi:ABC-type multidrug transport system permease subunit
MNLIFAILDWRGGAKWVPYLLVIGVLLALWLAVFILFLSQVPPEGLV